MPLTPSGSGSLLQDCRSPVWSIIPSALPKPKKDLRRNPILNGHDEDWEIIFLSVFLQLLLKARYSKTSMLATNDQKMCVTQGVLDMKL